MRASRMTKAQLADAVARQRERRPDKTAMTDEQRRAAGLMDLGQAAEHEHLHELLAARSWEQPGDWSRRPDPDDPWATP